MKFKILFLAVTFLILFGGIQAQSPPIDTTPAKGYMLGPGDEITGKVLGEPEFDFVATVNEDGMIEVPFFTDAIVAKCKTDRQLRAEVTTLLGKYLRTPQLSLRVTDRKSRPPATIYGEVKSPQQVVMYRKSTLVEMLALAAGVTDDAGGMIQVFRTQPPMCAEDKEDSDWKVGDDATNVPSRIYSIANVRIGKEEANPVIYPGDVIVVLKAMPVYITGEVVSPQGLYLKDGGTSLTEAIAKLGGIKQGAKTKDIKIYRLKSNSKDRDTLSANYEAIQKGLQKDILLEPYDIVVVDKAKDSLAKSFLNLAIGAGKGVVGSMTGGIGYRVLY